MQGIHRKKLSWDQELPSDMKKEFWTWADDLRHVTAVAVPRHLFNNKQRPRQAQLHVCCDASLKARGAVAYCRTENDAGKVNIALLGSKTRVAPLQDHSVARLELLAAELAVKIAQSIIKSLEGEIEFEVFFLDGFNGSALLGEWRRVHVEDLGPQQSQDDSRSISSFRLAPHSR